MLLCPVTYKVKIIAINNISLRSLFYVRSKSYTTSRSILPLVLTRLSSIPSHALWTLDTLCDQPQFCLSISTNCQLFALICSPRLTIIYACNKLTLLLSKASEKIFNQVGILSSSESFANITRFAPKFWGHEHDTQAAQYLRRLFAVLISFNSVFNFSSVAEVGSLAIESCL